MQSMINILYTKSQIVTIIQKVKLLSDYWTTYYLPVHGQIKEATKEMLYIVIKWLITIIFPCPETFNITVLTPIYSCVL